MKWTKFPSQYKLMIRIFSKYEAIDWIEDIPHGLVIGYFLSCYKAKQLKRRRKNEKSKQ